MNALAAFSPSEDPSRSESLGRGRRDGQCQSKGRELSSLADSLLIIHVGVLILVKLALIAAVLAAKPDILNIALVLALALDVDTTSRAVDGPRIRSERPLLLLLLRLDLREREVEPAGEREKRRRELKAGREEVVKGREPRKEVGNLSDDKDKLERSLWGKKKTEGPSPRRDTRCARGEPRESRHRRHASSGHWLLRRDLCLQERAVRLAAREGRR